MIDELALVGILSAAFAMISCLSVTNRRMIRLLPRGAWIAVILLVPVIGPIAWFMAGRPLRLGAAWPDRTAGQGGFRWRGLARSDPGSPAFFAPDDDAEFLRSLDDADRPSPPDPRGRSDRPSRSEPPEPLDPPSPPTEPPS